MLLRLITLLILLTTSVSCELFKQTRDAKVVAKVHDVNLYDTDIKNFKMPLGLSEKDSITVLMDYINDWATKQLILHEAKKNMTEKKQIEYNSLVEEYRLDLFSSAYENAYVKKNLKTGISNKEIELYYNKYKENFLLQEDLIQVRYIELPKKYKNLSATKLAFKRFNTEDINELSKLKLGFVKSEFNLEKKWITYETILYHIPSLKSFNKIKILKDDFFLNYKSNNTRFLVKIERVLKAGQPAPVSYVEDRIKQILLNKRKIKLKKQLEKEIREDALQTKEYQVFE